MKRQMSKVSRSVLTSFGDGTISADLTTMAATASSATDNGSAITNKPQPGFRAYGASEQTLNLLADLSL